MSNDIPFCKREKTSRFDILFCKNDAIIYLLPSNYSIRLNLVHMKVIIKKRPMSARQFCESCIDELKFPRNFLKI